MTRPFIRIPWREGKNKTNFLSSEPSPDPALSLGEPSPHDGKTSDEKGRQRPPDRHPSSRGLDGDNVVDSTTGGLSPAPLLPGPGQERWDESPTNTFRYLAVIYSFLVMGMNDGVTGALLPYVESYYDVPYTVVSLSFLSQFVGYIVAALASDYLHRRIGQRGIAVLAPLCRLAGFIPVAVCPPFPVLPVVAFFPGFCTGIQDSAWNAWVGNMCHANELLGLVHGAYGLGCTIGPLVATSLIVRAGLDWYATYYLMIGLAGLELIVSTAAFRTASAAKHLATVEAAVTMAAAQNSSSSSSSSPSSPGARGSENCNDMVNIASEPPSCPEEKQPRAASTKILGRVLRDPVVWALAIFLLGYVGAEVSIGGWTTTFMLRVRHAAGFDAGLALTYYWLGITLGRVTLGFVTGRVASEKLCMVVYMVLCVAIELLYWLVPSYAASAAAVALLGYFLGPFFPAAVVVAAKLLPPDMHHAGIGIIAAVGGAGGGIWPFIVGIAAQSKGIEVLQPIVLGLLGSLIVVWLLLPGGFQQGGLERARELHEGLGSGLRKVFRWEQERFAVVR